MSHLPLDARTILEYLNELGYRNISAEQLKEFLKGMQPQQSEISKSKHKAKSNSNQPPPPSQQQQQQLPATTQTTKPQRRPHLKILKSKKPLQNYKFYLDICDHQITKRIEEQIKQLGGVLEFFLTASVTHFITDKTVVPPTVVQNNNNNSNSNNNNNNKLSSSRPGTPQTPATPGTPQTPYSIEQNAGGTSSKQQQQQQTAPRTRQSRADAILNRARRQSTTTNVSTTTTTTSTIESAVTTPTIEASAVVSYTVWQTEHAFRFFNRIQSELKDYLAASSHKLNGGGKSYGACKPTNLKESFIKIESLKRNYRPYYQLFRKPTEWPKIELTRDDGAFRLSPKKTHADVEAEEAVVDKPAGQQQKMTRKSRSRSSQRQQPTAAVPAAVQALKKGGDAGAKATSAAAGQRNSNAGGGGACKQVKESSDKQCGVCEICKIEYDTLTIHLKTKDHEYFAKNSQNFIALDTLIHNSADVNKFLDENNKLELKTEELEEMEVEDDLSVIDVDAPDPLEDPLVVVQCLAATCDVKQQHRSSQCAHNTPSPTLREKSKRSTKGKHSSEKFRTTPKQTSGTAKSPKTPPKASTCTIAAKSPQKKPQQLAPSSSLVELQRINTAAAAISTAVAVTTPVASARRKPSTLSDHSPPIRAMLPPSSLYKVVETTEQLCTPVRKTAREAGEVAVGSPSLIVKFKKVRQTELFRLNGEAENFMFPKQRTSSEQPTDCDRQTTSDNVRVSVSSISLDSTSELMDVEVENTTHNINDHHCNSRQKSIPPQAKKAIATAKRRKGQKTTIPASAAVIPKQSFPSAPIQPEVQLKRLRKSSTTTALAAAAASAIVTATASITLPEATRKSSRTATAIVTAATTSSRLLRAAVAAAKRNRRRMAAAAAAKEAAVPSTTMITKRKSFTSMPTVSPPAKAKITGRGRSFSVVELEDRMGEDSNTDEIDDSDDDELDDSDDEPDDNDDYKDKDYKGTYKQSQTTTRLETTTTSHTKLANTRQERAALRQSRISDEEDDSSCVEEEEEEEEVPPPPPVVVKKEVVPPVVKPSKLKSQPHLLFYQQSPHKKSSPQRAFDHTKSERMDKLRYAFERLPAADLWYRVFARQDACEERYFEYFGSTKYRKLPYELGPIPFDRTLSGICCKLCNKGTATPQLRPSTSVDAKKIKHESRTTTSSHTANIKQEQESSNADAPPLSLNTQNGGVGGAIGTSPTPSGYTQSASSSQYTHKHKKLHLLQRYRQEQRDLLQKQQLHQLKEDETSAAVIDVTATTTTTTTMQCDSKASTPERERERAGSTHSTVSSCASSSTTLCKKSYHNKHLNKAAFLNLELPPRKSPREHASTLALVSCIIKQRQDSQSKPNSDTDEPPPTPTTPTPHETKPAVTSNSSCCNVVKTSLQTPIDVAEVVAAAIRSPRPTRSAAATPIEELRFATEISENVKRLRRGQNKYDHSPPLVLNTKRRARGRPPMTARTQSPLGRRNHLLTRRTLTPTTTQQRRKRKPKTIVGATLANQHHNSYGLATGSIRKTGSKKGVLEFEVDASALKALDTSRQHTNVQQLEWEVDRFLQLTGKGYDNDLDNVEIEFGGTSEAVIVTEATQTSETAAPVIAKITDSTNTSAATTTEQRRSKVTKSCPLPPAVADLNTPPHTDYFSSDFDLYDMFASTHAAADHTDDLSVDGRRKGFSVYSSAALHNYFRKRKTLKSNRTGWPKVQKKKSSARQQHKLAEKIRFLEGIGEANGGIAKQSAEEPLKDNDDDDDDDVTGAKGQKHESGDGVITPPDSDDEYDDDMTELDSQCKHNSDLDEPPLLETKLSDVEEDDEEEEEEEEDDDDDVDTMADSNDEEEEEPSTHNNILTPKTATAAAIAAAVPTSTPSRHMLRGLRRTPQLNGSLGSCISPSEKAGDNSDIFTVSSDGLDTDLDMSNSHSQHKGGGGDDDHCANHTPKRKFDLGKYASSNAAAATSSCAAEAAATAAVKSLAISQFLKKEVRVTCRRLRAPFRRFRYRR